MASHYIPTQSPADWKALLKGVEKHWKAGHSAKELAYSWEQAQPFPAEISSILETVPSLHNTEFLLGIPEYPVALPGGGAPSKNDLFVLANCAKGLVAMMVEGKCAETFGPPLSKWYEGMSRGKGKRLQFLLDTLQLAESPCPSIRYQLLHRTASAMITAKRFHAKSAVMLVHSFSQSHKGFEDYAAFLKLFGITAQRGTLHPVLKSSGIRLYCGWATGQCQAPADEC